MDLERLWANVVIAALCEWVDLELNSEWNTSLAEVLARDPMCHTVLEV